MSLKRVLSWISRKSSFVVYYQLLGRCFSYAGIPAAPASPAILDFRAPLITALRDLGFNSSCSPLSPLSAVEKASLKALVLTTSTSSFLRFQFSPPVQVEIEDSRRLVLNLKVRSAVAIAVAVKTFQTAYLAQEVICDDFEDSNFAPVKEKISGKRHTLAFKILDSFVKQGNMSFIDIATNAVHRATSNRFYRGNRAALRNYFGIKFNEDRKGEHGLQGKSGPLLSGVAYCISSCSMVLLNKVVLSSYGFNAGISLMFYQNFISVIVVLALKFLRVVTVEKLTWKLIRVWIPVNLIFVGMLVTGMYSLKYINIAMVTILKNMTNILTAIGEVYIFKKCQNRKVWTAMFLMVISAVSGGITDLSFDAPGYAWQVMNCILTASYSLTLRWVMDRAKQSTISGSLNEVSMVLLNNALSLPCALFLIILFGEWDYVYNVNLIKMPMFWVVATASGLLGLAISFTSMWFLSQTGPTTYSLVGSLNKIPLSVAGVFLFNVPLSLPNVFSILFGLFAGVFFARAKMS